MLFWTAVGVCCLAISGASDGFSDAVPVTSARPHTFAPPLHAFCIVISSVYSRSLPTGTPIAMRVTRDAERLEQPRQVDRGRLALDGGIGGEDDLLDAALLHAREQALDLQVVGTDALQRRQRAHQHVVDAREPARLLDRARRSADPRPRR